jgi:hypothetical protein
VNTSPCTREHKQVSREHEKSPREHQKVAYEHKELARVHEQHNYFPEQHESVYDFMDSWAEVSEVVNASVLRVKTASTDCVISDVTIELDVF